MQLSRRQSTIDIEHVVPDGLLSTQTPELVCLMRPDLHHQVTVEYDYSGLKTSQDGPHEGIEVADLDAAIAQFLVGGLHFVVGGLELLVRELELPVRRFHFHPKLPEARHVGETDRHPEYLTAGVQQRHYVHIDIDRLGPGTTPLHFAQPNWRAAFGNRRQLRPQLQRAIRDVKILEGPTKITI